MALDSWVMVGKSSFLDQVEPAQFVDQLQEAGVRNVVFGGQVPVEPNPEYYIDSPVQPRPPPPDVLAHVRRFGQLLRLLKDRGVGVYLYGAAPHGNARRDVYRQLTQKTCLDEDGVARPVDSYWGACANGPEFLPYYRGRIRDAHAYFPAFDGFLNDGPEFGYEIAPDFMGGNWSLFTCFGPCCQAVARELGYDWDVLEAAARRLLGWLHRLDGQRLGAIIDQIEAERWRDGDRRDPVAFLARASGDSAVADWFHFKADAIERYVRDLCATFRAVSPRAQVGLGSRTAAFAPLTGYDLYRLAPYPDFHLPKLYFWMGGYDGLYGTVYRWLATLRAWNPDVSETVLLRFVAGIFGFRLPNVGSLADLARYIDPDHLDDVRDTRGGDEFPDVFFDDVVSAEVRTLVQRVGDANRVRPWVGLSHGGRVMTARELDRLLTGAERGGLRTYLYYADLAGDPWRVMRAHHRPT